MKTLKQNPASRPLTLFARARREHRGKSISSLTSEKVKGLRLFSAYSAASSDADERHILSFLAFQNKMPPPAT